MILTKIPVEYLFLFPFKSNSISKADAYAPLLVTEICPALLFDSKDFALHSNANYNENDNLAEVRMSYEIDLFYQDKQQV